ncbi:MAG TPA: VOC family protein [Terriglobales bacterium]|nr:VOC family protein [Terriglobales bacterium]
MLRNRSCPNSTVIPELPYDDVNQAADWLCAAFGFTVRLRIMNHRCQINIGDGAMVAVEKQAGRNDVSRVMVRVENIDEHYNRAKAHGAMITREPADYPYGERQYNATDIGGHHWTFTHSIFDSDPLEWGGTPVDL